MESKNLIIWISLAGIIGVIFGIFYVLFGLNGLPIYQRIVPSNLYTSWSNGLYQAVFIGFNVLFFFVGRHAFQNKDKVLIKALLYGILSWLIVEASFCLYYGVYLNVLIDILLATVIGLSFVMGIKPKKSENFMANLLSDIS